MFLQSVDCRDVAMIQRCEQLRLTLKPGEPLGVMREFVGQDFNRPSPGEVRVLGAVDLADAALTEFSTIR